MRQTSTNTRRRPLFILFDCLFSTAKFQGRYRTNSKRLLIIHKSHTVVPAGTSWRWSFAKVLNFFDTKKKNGKNFVLASTFVWDSINFYWRQCRVSCAAVPRNADEVSKMANKSWYRGGQKFTPRGIKVWTHADQSGRNCRGTRWILPGNEGVSAGETRIPRACSIKSTPVHDIEHGRAWYRARAG